MANRYQGQRSKHYAQIKDTKAISWASDTQREAFEFGPSPICASGGWGAGKSVIFCLKVLYLATIFPKSRWVIGRRRWVELQKTTMATFFKFCPPQAYYPYGRRNDNEKVLELNNGSVIYWMYFDDPEIATVIRGLEVNGVFLDQAEEIQEDIFELLLPRIGRWDGAEVPESTLAMYDEWDWWRPDGSPDVPPWMMLAVNPDTEIHWIYRKFHPDSPDHFESPGSDPITGEVIPSYHDQGYRMLTMVSDDNKFVNKASIQALKKRDEGFQRRFRYGIWGIPEGQIHNVPRESIIPGDSEFVDRLLRTCTLHRSYDHGESSASCCIWWATDRHGNIFAYREYYASNQLIGFHRARITEMSRNESYSLNLADPSIWDQESQHKGGVWSVYDEYTDCTVHPRDTALFWMKADNNEFGTRDRINQYLQIDPDRVHPYTGVKGAPRLYFIEKSDTYPLGLYRVLQQVRSQRRLKVGMELGRPIFSDERDTDITDHGYDPVRYFIASRPPVAKETRTVARPGSFAAVLRRIKAFKRAGGHAKLARLAQLETQRRYGT